MLTKVGIRGFKDSEKQNFRVYAGVNFKSFIPIYKEQSFESIYSTIGKMLCFQELCNYNTPRVLRIEKHFLTLWCYLNG